VAPTPPNTGPITKYTGPTSVPPKNLAATG
jgi:hypothetical protein